MVLRPQFIIFERIHRIVRPQLIHLPNWNKPNIPKSQEKVACQIEHIYCIHMNYNSLQ